MRRKGFVFGDIHFPFHHPVVLALAMWLCVSRKPKYVVQIGDLYDKYSAAKFPRSFNVMTPSEERQWSRYYAEIFWTWIQEKLPGVECYQFLGNHCVRPLKRILEKAPEFEEELYEVLCDDYTFDGVKTIYEVREEFRIDDILFNHGVYTGIGKHHEFALENFVAGHTHQGGTVFRPLKGHLTKHTFEANAGYLANPYSRGLSYSLLKRLTRWTHGGLEIDELGPAFRPLWPDMARDITDKSFWDLVENLTHKGLFCEDLGTVKEQKITEKSPKVHKKGTDGGPRSASEIRSERTGWWTETTECPAAKRPLKKNIAKD